MSKFVRTKSCLYHLEPLELGVPKVEPTVAHHVFVLDRSGSMYYDINELKKQVEHVLAVNAATTGDVLTTLISFSSQGDVTVHWSRVAAREVIAGGNSYIDALHRIRATALTCISQALMEGLSAVHPEETTALTLFTDGYANHPSPRVENQRFDEFVMLARAFDRLFVNCVGYREWCDWPRMTAISSALHGKTVKAKSMLDVLKVMEDTQELLASGSVAMVRVDQAVGLYGSLMAVNSKTGAVIAADSDGTRASMVIPAENVADWEAYVVSRLDAADRAPRKARKADPVLAGALALGKLQSGDVNAAKALVFASGNKTIWQDYQAAFTASRLADFAGELGCWIRGEGTYAMGRNTEPKHNLFDLAEGINTAPDRSLALDTSRFLQDYKRRSVKKLMGKRLDDGSIEVPRSELVTGDAPVYIRAVDFNTADASMQLGTIQSARLRSRGGEILQQVAHVSLHSLASFRSYTILSSGEFNVEELPLRVLTKSAWDVLKPFVTAGQARRPFKANMLVKINLRRFGLPANTSARTPNEWHSLVERLMGATARKKVLSALRVKEATSDYSAEQIAALKDVHLTPALYHSPPTTVPYTDKDEAVAQGQIDFYTRYKVFFGTTDIRNPGDFRSGNAFLAAYFTGEKDGETIKKPKFSDHWDGASFTRKVKKGEPNNADQLMLAATEGLLEQKLTHELIEAELEKVNKTINDLYAWLRAPVFEIGCRGMLPASLAGALRMYTAEDYARVFGAKLKKAEQEATFYVCATTGLLVSIVPESCEYSTGLKVAAN